MKVKILTCENNPIPPGTILEVIDEASNHVWVKFQGKEYPYAWDEVRIIKVPKKARK